MFTTFETNFTVYPEHTNSMSPLIFGGAFFSEMDKAAANTVRRLIYQSDCKSAVTHKFSGTFHKPCYLGDLIFLECKVTDIGKKSFVIAVKAFREFRIADRETIAETNTRRILVSVPVESDRELVAEGEFVFVTVKDVKDIAQKPYLLPYHVHGLTPDRVAEEQKFFERKKNFSQERTEQATKSSSVST